MRESHCSLEASGGRKSIAGIQFHRWLQTERGSKHRAGRPETKAILTNPATTQLYMLKQAICISLSLHSLIHKVSIIILVLPFSGVVVRCS